MLLYELTSLSILLQTIFLLSNTSKSWTRT